MITNQYYQVGEIYSVDLTPISEAGDVGNLFLLFKYASTRTRRLWDESPVFMWIAEYSNELALADGFDLAVVMELYKDERLYSTRASKIEALLYNNEKRHKAPLMEAYSEYLNLCELCNRPIKLEEGKLLYSVNMNQGHAQLEITDRYKYPFMFHSQEGAAMLIKRYEQEILRLSSQRFKGERVL